MMSLGATTRQLHFSGYDCYGFTCHQHHVYYDHSQSQR